MNANAPIYIDYLFLMDSLRQYASPILFLFMLFYESKKTILRREDVGLMQG